jgi:exosome complex component RRP40
MSHYQYMPAVNDTVIGIVTDKSAESYKLHIGARWGVSADWWRVSWCGQLYFGCVARSGPGNLSALAFDGATKRNKPNLAVGALVFGRIESADRDLDPEITCKATGELGHKKDWVTGQGMFGELKQGTVVEVSTAYCRRYGLAFYLNSCVAVTVDMAKDAVFD